MDNKFKKAQEEMVGFALIIILVAVILVVFLAVSLRDKSERDVVESYETKSFVQSFLQYTTKCRNDFKYIDLQELIFKCSNKETCVSGKDSCELLEEELNGILEGSWAVQEGGKIKGYDLNISSNEKEFLLIDAGNQTENSRGSSQSFSRTGNSIRIFFKVYS